MYFLHPCGKVPRTLTKSGRSAHLTGTCTLARSRTLRLGREQVFATPASPGARGVAVEISWVSRWASRRGSFGPWFYGSESALVRKRKGVRVGSTPVHLQTLARYDS